MPKVPLNPVLLPGDTVLRLDYLQRSHFGSLLGQPRGLMAVNKHAVLLQGSQSCLCGAQLNTGVVRIERGQGSRVELGGVRWSGVGLCRVRGVKGRGNWVGERRVGGGGAGCAGREAGALEMARWWCPCICTGGQWGTVGGWLAEGADVGSKGVS